MTASSFDQLLRASRLALSAIGRDQFGVAGRLRTMPADRDQFEGKVKEGPIGSGGGATAILGGKKGARNHRKEKQKAKRAGKAKAEAALSFDRRQRAITKVHYFSHAGGGGAALGAHARYVARDGAGRNDLSELVQHEDPTRAHADYLSRARKDAAPVFYDATSDGVDGAARVEDWARADKRHFRVVLSAENGAELPDLPAYTREVMARAEIALGTRLHWVAVDHHDTDNPHTHLIIRGRNAKGQDLVLPRDFIKHGFANIARDVATTWLGERTPADARLALDREVLRHGPTRLDRLIAAQLPEDATIRLAKLEAPNGDAALTAALKARAGELKRMGLARDVRRNVMAFEHDWQDRLRAMEQHLDIRQRVVRERTEQRRQERSVGKGLKGLIDR